MRHSTWMFVVASLFCNSSWASVELGKGFKARALVDSYYQYNFNKPPISESPATVPQNNYRAFDRAHNQFQLNSVILGLSHDADPVGFVAEVGFGPMMDALNLVDVADTTVDRTNVYIRRAFGEWKKGEYALQVGRIDANFGLEGIETATNWNYSHSMQFALMQPRFFTGINNAYHSQTGFLASLGVFNGINRFNDNNRGKTLATKLGYLKDKVDAGLSYVTGPENDARGGDWRHTVGLHAKYMFNDLSGVGFDTTAVFGNNDQINAAGLRSSAQRFGAALLGNLKICDKATTALRLEWLRDDDGAATLRRGETDIWAVTLTQRWWANDNLSFWLEGRYDDADARAFSNKTGALNEENQFTATIAATYAL